VPSPRSGRPHLAERSMAEEDGIPAAFMKLKPSARSAPEPPVGRDAPTRARPASRTRAPAHSGVRWCTTMCTNQRATLSTGPQQSLMLPATHWQPRCNRPVSISTGGLMRTTALLGVKFSGFIAWWSWRTVSLAKPPGLAKKLRVKVGWTRDLFFGREIEQRSRYGAPTVAAVATSIVQRAAGPFAPEAGACRLPLSAAAASRRRLADADAGREQHPVGNEFLARCSLTRHHPRWEDLP